MVYASARPLTAHVPTSTARAYAGVTSAEDVTRLRVEDLAALKIQVQVSHFARVLRVNHE